MRHILRNPIGEVLAAVGIAWAEAYGRFRDWCEPDRVVCRFANDTHEGDE